MGDGFRCEDRWGRVVGCASASLEHIAEGHPEVRPGDVQAAVESADQRTRGRGPGSRELLWASKVGPARWMVVVVSYRQNRGFVVTAYGSTKGPPEADKI